MNKHRWSGWPGAFCLKCGQWDLMENAIGTGVYDPYADTWKDGVDPEDYNNGECSVKDDNKDYQTCVTE